MHQYKLAAGHSFPDLQVPTLAGKQVTLGQPRPDSGADWQMVVVYRGRHCPFCTKYLNHLEKFKAELEGLGIDIIAVSADSRNQLEDHLSSLNISFPIAYGLTEEQMQALGLYISLPRSENETDHNFAESGLFVIDGDGNIQIITLSNNPFVRPELPTLVAGLKWIRENHYPIRGTLTY